MEVKRVGDTTGFLNNRSEIVLSVTPDNIGNSCSMSNASLEMHDVHIEKDVADFVEFEIYDKNCKMKPLIAENLVKNVPDEFHFEETLKTKHLYLSECESPNEHSSATKGRKEKVASRIQKSSKSSDYNLKELRCNSCNNNFSCSSDLLSHVKIHSSEKQYQCDQCCKTFRQQNHFNMHRQSHIEKSFKCSICAETLKSRSSLNSHMNKHLGVKKFGCDVCSAAFHSKYELKIHMIKHAGDLPYNCLVCDDKFSVKSRLKRHMMIHTGERPFQCEVCGEIFREQLTLDIHMSVHLSHGPYHCDVCGENFSRLNALTLHRRVHKTDNTYSYIPKSRCRENKDGLHLKNLQEDSSVGDSIDSKSSSEINSSHKMGSEGNLLNFSVCEANSRIDGKLHDNVLVIGNNSKANEKLHPCVSEAPTMTRYDLRKCLLETEGTNIPHPTLIQEVLSSGTVLQSQNNGKGYFIVVPKTLAEKSCTLYTACPTSEVLYSKTVESQNAFDIGNEQALQNNDNHFVNHASVDSARPSAFEMNHERNGEEVHCKLKKVKKLKSAIYEDIDDIGFQSKKVEKIPKKKIKKVIASKLYSCCLCGKSYKSTSNLNIHLRIHTGERPYSCDVCRKGFKQMAHLQSHVRIHTGENPYQCHLCDQAFNQSSRLKYHIDKKHHNITEKKVKAPKSGHVRNFYCKICNRTFIDSCYKTDHMKTHVRRKKSEENPEASRINSRVQKSVRRSIDCGICELCGFQYKDIETLVLHKKKLHDITEDDMETGVKQNNSYYPIEPVIQNKELSCPSDDSSKQSVPSIKASEDGKYECSVCTKIFNSRSNALIHLRLHSNVRPYTCSECGKSFRQISHIKDHVKRHTGEKPFSCSICQAAFTQSSSVKSHIKKRHKGKGYVVKSMKVQSVKCNLITMGRISL